MNYKKLNNNIEIPVLGYGVYNTPSHETSKHVLNALKSGYRLIDTAQNYANEHEVGEAIHESRIKREEVFVTTKTQTSGYDATIRGINKSLDEFGYDYFDLILIHWPNDDNIGTYNALEDAYHDGKTRSIGLSNFNSNQMLKILQDCSIKPAVNQIETHILWQQKKMHTFLDKHECAHMAWSPFASGYMNIFQNKHLKIIANKYKKTVGQIMLKFLIQEDITAIPKSTNINRIRENINLFDFTIDDEDMNKIRKLDQKTSYCNWPTTMRQETGY